MNRTIAKSIIFFFSLIGLLISIIFVHENFHKFDFRNVEKTEDSICYFALGDDTAGYYTFSYLENQTGLVKEKKKTSEIKAYLIESPLFAIYLWCLFALLWERKPKELKEIGNYR